jgi:hypothetical protein
MAKLKFDNKLRPISEKNKKWVKKITKLVNRDWEPDNKADPKDVYKRKGADYYSKWAKKSGKHFIH